ncbi:ubiquinol--cytochrome-c reductase subunit 8 [Aspergillus aculeatinus CBS 121060]|uniref:UcrQ-domain-containing protein n=1 Tax=Aspergillus aculeatinus CBS 121060 TaxID=1448322 RepID=A0ACD1GUT3_9EURO|nr:UcrQ-domain-containing protein [Aspergillus aculeatinus CBS 121060]RAH65080.1 UcrQ-domain-containing protein [Aspergillus aculeatinus CBS 121060]
MQTTSWGGNHTLDWEYGMPHSQMIRPQSMLDAAQDDDYKRCRLDPPTMVWLTRITSYSLSPNRQRPLAGAGHAAIFNTFRRFRHQVLYVAPPFIAAYALMNWAIERNEYLNSKPGRLLEGGEE